jgi:hypothetical protein
MPESSPQSQANSPQNDVSEPLLASPNSGMIVFSSSARILYMNGSARTLMALFNTSHGLWPQIAPESMPSILTELYDDVLAQLHRRGEAQDRAQFEIRRICHMVTPPLLFTGFGVQNLTNREIRVILTLTPLLSTPCDATDSQYFHPSVAVHAPASGAIL